MVVNSYDVESVVSEATIVGPSEFVAGFEGGCVVEDQFVLANERRLVDNGVGPIGVVLPDGGMEFGSGVIGVYSWVYDGE